VIGLVVARLGAGSITMTDTNLLAVQAARHNADALAIPARVLASDVYAHLDDARFDLIVSNPPFHRGKQVDLSVANHIIAGAPARLHPGGSLLLVANAFLAYGKQMATVFDRVETVAATPQYHVLRGEIR
jgi:16S rRNA (guanine1207-N2)-methyltransferase